MGIIFNSLFNTMWVGGVFQQIFLAVDSIIYGIAGKMYNLFNTTVALNDYGNESSSQLFSTLPDIVSRIKTLFIVFMLFRLAFTLLGYLANPEKLSDSKSGSSKLVMNVVVSLAMLIVSPYVFDLFNRIQYETMGSGSDGSNIIANIVLGDDGHVITGEAAGGKFVNKVFLLFCNIAGKSYTDDDSKNYSGFYSFLIFPPSASRVEEAFDDVNNGAPLGILATYISSTKIYYWPFISGIAGIFLIYFFFSFAIEVFIRLLKLKILEVISPVPILMYMDSGGQKYFQNFIKLYISVFLSFYLKLAGIYLAISLSTNVLKNWVADSSGIWLKLVVVMGIFYLTKELPKIFKDLFGVDMGDGKMKGAKFLSGLAGAGILAAAGGIKSAATGMGFGGALIGAASGAIRGGIAGGSAQNVGQFVKGNYAAHQKNSKFIDTAKSVGGYGAMAMHGYDSLTGANKRSERDIAAIKDVESKRATMQSTTESEFARGTNSLTGQNWGTKDEFVNNDKDVQSANTALQEFYKNAANSGGTINSTDETTLRNKLSYAQNNAKSAWTTGYNNFVNNEAIKAAGPGDVSTLSESARTIRDYNTAVDSNEVQSALKRNVDRAAPNNQNDVKAATNIQKVDGVQIGPIRDNSQIISGKDKAIANATAGTNASRQAEYKRNSGGN